MMKGIKIGCVLILLGITIWFQVQQVDCLQKDVAKEVIRFHVLANSDSKEDQEEKRKVRNSILPYMQNCLIDVDNVEEARACLEQKKEQIEKVANKTLEQLGSENRAKAILTYEEFPVNNYGEMVFPAGIYEALQVKIGKAEGHNWWCVMYPTLCTIQESYVIADQNKKQEIGEKLTEKEYEEMTCQEEPEFVVEYRFKLVEMFSKKR